MKNSEKVSEFMVTYGQDVSGIEAFLKLGEYVAFRRRLVEEELDEMDQAIGLLSVYDILIEMFDAGLDILYFGYGTLLGLGLTPEIIEAGMAEVHRSNMSKLDENGKPIFREDGKVLKGPNYSPPDLRKVLQAYKKIP